ncbi:benzyl alcohol O-benzoyltransferase-like [Impatiens glandulifera]|uniref:benzyl alcohol O-benzoyltransferase-like n=1 Tax=Impatiens glandulifera TaxID=253017 RepID=UPI001FB16062|nr:benzyl alcohol O-benzoyltransferase-like [Impatiens glandulifera]
MAGQSSTRAFAGGKEELVLTVRRQEAQLVVPAKPTPRVHLPLSDIDDQEALRIQVPITMFYGGGSHFLQSDRDPVKVIREALSEALVFYYPLAGRLRELGPDQTGSKLMVDCTGELGILFIEADADVTLMQLGLPLQPPFPYLEDLLLHHDDVQGRSVDGGILGCSLLLFQVTRLTCSGFVVACRLNHTMCDGTGLVQFLTAVGDLARGRRAPSAPTVWERKLLSARDPLRVTCTHHEYDQLVDDDDVGAQLEDLVHRSFFFGSAEIETLRQLVPSPEQLGRRCTSFDLMTACIWRCRTIALGFEPNQDVRFLCVVNARNKYKPPLPTGYYGNAIAFPAALTTAGMLCKHSLEYALKLVMKTKENVTEEYMRSTADLMVLKGRPPLTTGAHIFLISDLRRLGFGDVDFGWGKACYAGAAMSGISSATRLVNYYVSGKNDKDEDGDLLLISLPATAMKVFEDQLQRLLKHGYDILSTL